MSEKEKIKEEIGWLKLVFGLLTAVDVPLIAWLFNNFSVVPLTQVLTAISLVIIITCAMIKINFRIYKNLNRLREL